MSLALIVDRKGIRHRSITDQGMYFPPTRVPLPLSFLLFLSENDTVGLCYRGRMERESHWGNWLTQVHLEGCPVRAPGAVVFLLE